MRGGQNDEKEIDCNNGRDVSGTGVFLWIAGQVFGFGVSFDKPGIPQGSHTQGPSGKGTITYVVNQSATPWATIEFHGQCNGKAVDTGKLDVTPITNYNNFANATAQAIADSVDNFFTDNPVVVAPFQACYNNSIFGVYVTAVDGAGSKTAVPNPPSTTIYIWTGGAAIKGVR